MIPQKWHFWIDRGGTFTDVVALSPDGQTILHKLLSENPAHYPDAAIHAIRTILGTAPGKKIPVDRIDSIAMGTTVATNALLERKGERTLLATTKGFKDAVRIAYQNRPNIFALEIVLPEMLYADVVEVEERIAHDGSTITPLNEQALEKDLRQKFKDGFRSIAVCFMHGYRFDEHEKRAAAIARKIGFTQISVSSETIPLLKFVSRADTTLSDAYLSPVLNRYVQKLQSELKGTRLMFMQSNGGLADAQSFRGKDSILSGPAGGVVGAVKTAEAIDQTRIITFDMGGTSTDVGHFNGILERAQETEISGVRIRSPVLSINTVAAGGGSILSFDGSKYRVGPESAGANPGPACYRAGGPLTVTDCNVMLGKISPRFFPKLFGRSGNESIDANVVQKKFVELANSIKKKTGDARSPEDVAEGFLQIAVARMASAIKQISTEKGHDLSNYSLVCFGGAGGQHACLIAEELGIKRIIIHPYAGVLSALGIGLAEMSTIRQRSVETVLDEKSFAEIHRICADLAAIAKAELIGQGAVPENIVLHYGCNLRYEGTDTALFLPFEIAKNKGDLDALMLRFQHTHQQQFGFTKSNTKLIVESVSAEATQSSPFAKYLHQPLHATSRLAPQHTTKIFSRGAWQIVPVFLRANLCIGDEIIGPAIVIEPTSTTVCEPGWTINVQHDESLMLVRSKASSSRSDSVNAVATDKADPVRLELFNNLFMSIAEQMGVTLQNTSHSVNIKERLDFSCALFDAHGNLIANAPHIPVHLGSMGESVQQLVETVKKLNPGDVYALNDPYHGGTHLPDITVITPVFIGGSKKPEFFVASRGHHADVGGITPGSMPPNSTHIEEEGILLNCELIAQAGQFLQERVSTLFTNHKYPARNIRQNLADLQAQIAANHRGVTELQRLVDQYGIETVRAYMRFVQENAEEAVRRVIDKLTDGSFTCRMDNGIEIKANISIDKKNRSATIDFSGSSSQHTGNHNAPKAVCKAAVIYVFRTLVQDTIPLNAGCMKPLNLVIPKGSVLDPQYPAAVVAGNVETSQIIVDTLYGALGVMSASQGTMNNFTFGNAQYQYYETICGGSGAGSKFHGTDAVHTHMTNSRLTDPEVLELRFPVRVEEFAIREVQGGNGKFKGGRGVIRKIRFNEDMEASILSGRREIAPHGVKGGEPGAPGANYVCRKNGELEKLSGTASVSMSAGDVFVIETPGGGGFGKPV